MDSNYRKIVITKGIVEVFEYERLNVMGEGGKKKKIHENQDENYKKTQKARRNNLRQLITSNFDSGSKFITLTFDDKRKFDIRDVKECNKAFKKFARRLRNLYPELKYVSVIEFQDKNKRGAVHYHMVCNLPYIKKSELAEMWGQGFIKINRIDKVDNIGAYVIKYMTTNLDDMRLKGLKAYNQSKGLEKPTEVKSWEFGNREILYQIDETLKEKSPSYFREYESEKAGLVTYKQYNFNR